MRHWLLPLLILPAPAAAQAPQEAAGAAHARAFLAGETAGLWQAMTPQMQAAFGGEAAFAAFRASLPAQIGEEGEVTGEAVSPSPLGDIYERRAVWSKAGPLALTIVTDAAGRVAGLHLAPAAAPAPSRFLDHRIGARLRLPFDGEWTVFWGGRALIGNYHAADPAQRFALDLVVARDGATFEGDPARLESYFCWGRPVLAPGAGRVVAAVDGLPDQPIGSSDAARPAGNHVVVDLGQDEFVFLAHLRQGSVTVAPGDSVVPGQEIGRCGNSGNTSEPHLHVHLQTTPDLAAGEGLPAQFHDYVADGAPVDRGEPVRGQVIAPQG